MIGDNIRFLRKNENLSQEEFAERFGVSRQSVAKWESGESVPELMKAWEIAEYYELTVDTLISLSLDGADIFVPSASGKYLFGTVRVGENGQVTLPEYALEVFGVNTGDTLVVMGDTVKGGIALAKVSLGDFLKQ